LVFEVATERLLIVNADDLGLTSGVNRGIMAGHERGIVTSASLMVCQQAAEEAVALSRRHPRLAVGLHVDLGEWTLGDDGWVARYEVVDLEDAGAIDAAVVQQLHAFRRLVGREPTHLDSHQHVHLREPAASVLRDHARRLGLPLRHHDPRVSYLGDFHGQTGTGGPLPEAVTAEHLIELIARVGQGWTELACHPGEVADAPFPYRGERRRELQALCDRRVRGTLHREGIVLRSFAELPPIC
jgi:predicted glycoside hydrolase/deacetylase ChbG (UPF0249 family)